jgi:hypothetical protein
MLIPDTASLWSVKCSVVANATAAALRGGPGPSTSLSSRGWWSPPLRYWRPPPIRRPPFTSPVEPGNSKNRRCVTRQTHGRRPTLAHMADSPESDEQVEVFGGAEYRFATHVDVAQPGTMVYLDFYQQDPRRSERGEHVGQVVILPQLARDLAETVRDAARQ